MNDKIVQIDDSSKQRAVYSLEQQRVNHETGEILEDNKIRVAKETKKENFIKLYVENLYFMSTELTSHEKTVMFFLLMSMGYKNVVTISSDLRKAIIETSKLSRMTIHRAIKGLKEKDLLMTPTESIKELFKQDNDLSVFMSFTKNTYIINPNIIGKGKLEDLKKMRQVVTTEYDFEKLEATKEIIKEVEYKGLETVKNGNTEIVDIKKNENEKLHQKTLDITLKDKKSNNDYEIVTLNEKKNDNDLSDEDKILELQLQNARNRAKELEIEEKKLNLEIEKMRLSQKQGTLDLE